MTKILFVAVALFAALVSSLSGQTFAVPRSDEVAHLELTLPTGVIGKAVVRDGTMLTVQDDDLGYMYGFAVAIDPRSNQVKVTSVEITDLAHGGQKVAQFHGSEEDTIAPGGTLPITAKFNSAKLRFALRLVEISTGQFPNIRPLAEPLKSGLSPDQLKAIFGKSGGGACCVSCGSITLCSTDVTMDCGSCSSGGRLSI